METKNELNEETRDLLLDIAGKLEAVRDEVVGIHMGYKQRIRILLTEDRFLQLFTDYSYETDEAADGEGHIIIHTAEKNGVVFVSYRYIYPGSAYALGGV